MAGRVLGLSCDIVCDGEFQDVRLRVVTLGYTCKLDMSMFFAVLVVFTVRGQRLKRFWYIGIIRFFDIPLCSFFIMYCLLFCKIEMSSCC